MHSIGIDLDGETINVAILNKNKDLIDIKCFDINELNGSKNVNPFYTTSKKTFITTGLELQDVLIKTTPFDVKKIFFIKKALKFQREFITTIDPSRTISVPLYLKHSSTLKFFITTKELLNKHLNRLRHLDIDPDFITCTGIALCSFAAYFFKNTKNAFLIHIGQNKTSCIFMKDNIPEKTFNIKTGSKKLKSDYSEYKKSKNSQLDVLSLNHDSKLYETLTDLKESIKKAFISFTNDQENKYPLILTGDFEVFTNLDKFLLNEKISTTLFNEKLDQKPKTKTYAISIGLALSLLTKDSNIVQFRKDEFTSNKTFIAIGKKFFFFGLFTIFILCLSYFTFSHLLKKKEKVLHENLFNLKKLEVETLNKNNKTTIKNFRQDLDEYEKKLLKEAKEFPYFVKIPNITETLSWLNNHEYLQNTEITSFNYELQKYPNIYAKTDPYTAKIELEFKTKIPAIARSFYDSLTKGEGLADPKEEITWEVGNDYYKTSFYLKRSNPRKKKL